MSTANPTPSRCLESKPTTQSVQFSGPFINLSDVGSLTGLTVSHLSMIFAGKREPSLKTAKKIASALGMDLTEFVEALDEHVSARKIAALLDQE